jgi:hypothetical protein
MRFTRTAFFSVLTLALAASAAPALAADDGTRDISAALQGGPRWLWEDRPECPPGERAAWVDRDATPGKLYVDPLTGRITWEPGEPAFHGWQCQPITLRPLGP